MPSLLLIPSKMHMVKLFNHLRDRGGTYDTHITRLHDYILHGYILYIGKWVFLTEFFHPLCTWIYYLECILYILGYITSYWMKGSNRALCFTTVYIILYWLVCLSSKVWCGLEKYSTRLCLSKISLGHVLGNESYSMRSSMVVYFTLMDTFKAHMFHMTSWYCPLKFFKITIYCLSNSHKIMHGFCRTITVYFVSTQYWIFLWPLNIFL